MSLYISLVIGISTPSLSASSYAASAVNMPSTTIPTFFTASSGAIPSPIIMPHRLFLECMLVQVTIKSPMPVSPAKVLTSAPILTPRRFISAMPLVIIAALALSPNPSPSDMPAPRAIMFFKAPPSSTPVTSVPVYTLRKSVENIS